MNGLSLHYYTLPTGNWQKKGSATEFDEAAWFATLRDTLHMDELVARHSAIMDKYDPEKKVGLVVDEWGAWYDVEPGTNPAFLFQQNTLRDAIVAGAQPPHFPEARRPGGRRQHRADGERAAGDDPHGRSEDDRHADVLGF